METKKIQPAWISDLWEIFHLIVKASNGARKTNTGKYLSNTDAQTLYIQNGWRTDFPCSWFWKPRLLLSLLPNNTSWRTYSLKPKAILFSLSQRHHKTQFACIDFKVRQVKVDLNLLRRMTPYIIKLACLMWATVSYQSNNNLKDCKVTPLPRTIKKTRANTFFFL